MRARKDQGRRGRAWKLLAVVLGAGMIAAACGSSGPSGTPASSSSSSSTTTASTGLGSYVPLYPFATAADVAAWQQSYRDGGHQAWHLDARQTALSFAGWLGFSSIDTVIAGQTDSSGAHVTVAGRVPDSTQTYSAAVVHLVRFGSGSSVPWEVVGTDDTTFSVTTPRYGSTVSSPVLVGGSISGVDENIRVEARTLGSSDPVGVSCCRPAGGDRSPWQLRVPFSSAPGSVLTFVASTGGHVAAVERFAVTGVRAAPSTTATASACRADALLPVVQAALALPAPDSTARVDVEECGGGYARVTAVPTNTNCGKPGGSCYDNVQVFLQATAGSWKVLDTGTGIDCAKQPAADAAACRALGLS